MSKLIITGMDALEKIHNGVNKLADAVKITLGPSGKIVILPRGFGGPHLTKDGYTVAEDVELDDPTEQQACNVIKQVSKETADLAGDGSTSSLVLIQALFNFMFYKVRDSKRGDNKVYLFPKFRNFIDKIFNINKSEEVLIPDMIKGLEDAKDSALDILSKSSRNVKSVEDVGNVALISSNGDTSMSSKIIESLNTLGMDARITRDPNPSVKQEDTLTIKQGYVIEKGYASPTFGDPSNGGKSYYENPIFLLKSGDINDFGEVVPFLELSSISKRPLVVMAHDFSEMVLSFFVKNHLSTTTPSILVIKSPGMIDKRDAYIKDIAAVVGYNIDLFNIPKKIQTIKDLGSVETISSTPSETVLIPKEEIYSSEEFSKYLEDLAKIDLSSSPTHIQEFYKIRVSKLTSKAASISLHAKTDSEMKERIDRLEDTIEAVKSVISEGYVVGGGMTYNLISSGLRTLMKDIPITTKKERSYKLGWDALSTSLVGPFVTLCENAELDAEDIVDRINSARLKAMKHDPKYNISDIGINIRSGKIGNLLDMGVIDPTKVLRIGISTAVSTSKSLISTGCIISFNR